MAFALREVKLVKKVLETVFVSLNLSIDVFTKKQWLVVFWFRFGVYTISLYDFTGNSNFQSWIIINAKYRANPGMNRFAALN